MTTPIPFFIFNKLSYKLPEDINGIIWEYFKDIPCKPYCPCYNCWAGCWFYNDEYIN